MLSATVALAVAMIATSSAYADPGPDRTSRVLESAGLASSPLAIVTMGQTEVMAKRPAAVLTANGMRLGVTLEGAKATGSVGKGADRIYNGVSGDSDEVVQARDSTVRFTAVMNSPRASSTQRYHLDVPAGTRLESIGSGYLLINAENVAVGAITAPTAKDATGRSLATSYTMEGTTLVQRTDMTGAVYPAVAVQGISFGEYVYFRFNPAQRREIWLTVAAAGGTAAGIILCSELPVFGQAVCAALGAVAGVIVFEMVYDQASNRPECGQEIQMTYAGSYHKSRLIKGDSSTNC